MCELQNMQIKGRHLILEDLQSFARTSTIEHISRSTTLDRSKHYNDNDRDKHHGHLETIRKHNRPNATLELLHSLVMG